jgi:dTDP-4-amino-4,6-dideoxygalactose transaminase
MKSIPFFNYPAMFQSSKQEYMTAIEEVLDRGAFILQRDIETFEHSLADYLGVKHAIGVANCTDGLTIAMRVAGIQPGDEVIFPSHTFVATAAAIHENGATPVPVECGMDHMLDPATIEAAITTKTRAIVPVQLNGRTCAMDVIQRIADKH